MKQIAWWTEAIILIISFNPAHARGAELVSITEIRPLIEWVETRTNLMLLPRPKIFVSSEALSKLTDAVDSAESQNHQRIAAYRDGVILINEDYWHPGNIADESVVVHELVHYAQDVGGLHYACSNLREEEAYRMQNMFLLEHGERAFLDEADMDRLAVCH